MVKKILLAISVTTNIIYIFSIHKAFVFCKSQIQNIWLQIFLKCSSATEADKVNLEYAIPT
jgi:hypothetical protein